MSNTNAAVADGKARRKTLADQLDRLDRVIDDLADGLNETVAQVVTQAVTTAVKQAVEGLAQAVLSNPELLRTLAEQLSPPSREEATASPSEGASPTSGPPVGPLARSRCGVSGPLRRAGAACAAVRRRVGALLDGVGGRLRLARVPLLVLGLGGAAVATAWKPYRLTFTAADSQGPTRYAAATAAPPSARTVRGRRTSRSRLRTPSTRAPTRRRTAAQAAPARRSGPDTPHRDRASGPTGGPDVGDSPADGEAVASSREGGLSCSARLRSSSGLLRTDRKSTRLNSSH